MCTALIQLDPDAAWPLRLAFVRDEDRSRRTDLPAAWWPQQPSVIGGRDARAGGTWLAVDHEATAVAMLTDQYDPAATLPDPHLSPTRGALPLLALARGEQFDLEAHAPGGDVRRYQPFHLVTIRSDRDAAWLIDHCSWDGSSLQQARLDPGMHVIASRALTLPGEPERRRTVLSQLERVAAAAPDLPAAPDTEADTRDAWDGWLDLLDGRDAQPDQFDTITIHSTAIRPGFGTVGASLIALAADGSVRYDVNPTATVDPAAWQRVAIP